MPEATKNDDVTVVGGHEINGTRIWCDRAPYDVTEDVESVQRCVEHFLREKATGVDVQSLLRFTMAKNLLPCALVAGKISAIEPHVVR